MRRREFIAGLGGTGRMLETVCAENNVDVFYQNLFPQPQAKTPDF